MGTIIAKNNIGIEQCENAYQFCLPSGQVIGRIVMPPDGAYMADSDANRYISKALALRWHVYKKPNGPQD